MKPEAEKRALRLACLAVCGLLAALSATSGSWFFVLGSSIASTFGVQRSAFGVQVTPPFVPAPPVPAQEEALLTCEPRVLHAVPGEPLRVELTLRCASARPVRLHLPAAPLLLLRAVEKIPVRRTQAGDMVHARVVIWQALGPGVVRLDNLTAEVGGKPLRFPDLTITIADPGELQKESGK